MHLCFAIPWRTSWKPLWYILPYDLNTHLTFSVSLFMIFSLCCFSCYNMVAKFYCQDYVSYAHVLSTLISTLNALLRWSRLWWCIVTSKIILLLSLTYSRTSRSEASGCLIRLKRIYNFWCSMLILHHLLHVLFTLCGVLMRFLELTYWQDATVPVPVFCYFCVSKKLHRKYSRNWTEKSRNFYFSQKKAEDRTAAGGGPEGSLTIGWPPWPAWPHGEVALVTL
jgi:hypothetical protein